MPWESDLEAEVDSLFSGLVVNDRESHGRICYDKDRPLKDAADRFLEADEKTREEIRRDADRAMEAFRAKALAKPRKTYPWEKQITHEGRTLSVRAWAIRLGIPYQTLYSRLTRMDPSRALSGKSLPRPGKHGTLAERARAAGLKPETVRTRLNRGATLEEALRPKASPVLTPYVGEGKGCV